MEHSVNFSVGVDIKELKNLTQIILRHLLQVITRMLMKNAMTQDNFIFSNEKIEFIILNILWVWRTALLQCV